MPSMLYVIRIFFKAVIKLLTFLTSIELPLKRLKNRIKYGIKNANKIIVHAQIFYAIVLRYFLTA